MNETCLSIARAIALIVLTRYRSICVACNRRDYHELSILFFLSLFPDEKITFAALCKQFDAAPATINDRLARLESAGLVTYLEKSGRNRTLVLTDAGKSAVQRSLEIEGGCIKHIFPHVNPEDLTRLAELLTKISPQIMQGFKTDVFGPYY